jgi:xylulokinase
MIDTSSAMLLTRARVGQLMNSIGSTDVLALCTDRPKPHERLLTRALGIGKRWMSVSTLAAAGSSLVWMHDQLFADYSWERFNALTRKLAAKSDSLGVRFEPYLAGDRTSIEQRSGAFSGLTLSTTREEMLRAVIESLATASAARLKLLGATGTKMLRRVVVSGGGTRGGLEEIIHRDWAGRWEFVKLEEATLRGLSKLIAQ